MQRLPLRVALRFLVYERHEMPRTKEEGKTVRIRTSPKTELDST